jgi:hypothetical protein
MTRLPSFTHETQILRAVGKAIHSAKTDVPEDPRRAQKARSVRPDKCGGGHADPFPEIVDRREGLIGASRDDRGAVGSGNPLTRRRPRQTANRLSSNLGSRVQCQLEAFTQTGRMSTPWAWALRTIYAGA